MRVLAKASAAEDVKGGKVGLASLAVRLPTVPPEDAPTAEPLIQRRSALVSNHLV